MSKQQSNRLLWLSQLLNKHKNKITNRIDLINMIRQCGEENLIKSATVSMLEGVIQIESLQAENIMIPRSQITFIQRNDDYRSILTKVLSAGHSRYPVIDESMDDIHGILHAKDLLKYSGKEDQFNIDDILRHPIFATENTRLNELLTNFKKSRNHMAIILDEYTALCGVVTMEDVLEQIVGDIDDEYDNKDDSHNIFKSEKHYNIKASTSIEEFNQYFKTDFYDKSLDTMGGYVIQQLGRMPQQGDHIELQNFYFEVMSCDARRIHLLKAIPSPEKRNLPITDIA